MGKKNFMTAFLVKATRVVVIESNSRGEKETCKKKRIVKKYFMTAFLAKVIRVVVIESNSKEVNAKGNKRIICLFAHYLFEIRKEFIFTHYALGASGTKLFVLC